MLALAIVGHRRRDGLILGRASNASGPDGAIAVGVRVGRGAFVITVGTRSSGMAHAVGGGGRGARRALKEAGRRADSVNGAAMPVRRGCGGLALVLRGGTLANRGTDNGTGDSGSGVDILS